MPKKIIFLSCYRHHRRFFSWLNQKLPSGISGEVVHVMRFPQGLRRLYYLFGGVPVPEATITALCASKYLSKHPGSRLRTDTVLALQKIAGRASYRSWLTYFRKAKPDLLVVWNGMQLPLASAAAAAREAGVKTLFCENGYLPHTVVMDPNGVNAGGSLIGKGPEFYRAVEPSAEKLAEIYTTAPVARGLNPKTHKRPEAEDFTLPVRYVFLPLQVHDDSQILMYSPRFADMPSVVRSVAKAVQSLGGGLKLVVKEHPSDYGRIDYSALRAAFPDVQFTRTFPTRDLIAGAAAVVTVNSTVGIEGVLARRPVLTLGRAFYNVPGVVRPLGDTEDVADALADTLATPPDQDLRDRFLYYLRYVYLVALDKRAVPDADPAPALQRLQDTLS